MAHIQNIERAVTLPPIGAEAAEWFQDFVREYVTQLSQQVQSLHQSFEAREISVGVGVANVAVVWTSPAPDATYIVNALPDWSTTIFYSARTTTGVTLNFGTVAPGAQVVLVLRVR
jgi:hypothetical protein